MRNRYLIGMYLAAIVVANLLVAALGPAVSIANALFFIGLDLSARDRLHEAWQGRGLVWRMGAMIAGGSLLSYLLALALPSALEPEQVARVALASLVAFGASASIDALTYALLRERAYMVKVNGSNVAGAAVDSVLFLALAFGWPPAWLVVAGQLLAKIAGGFAWSIILAPSREAEAARSVG